MEKTERTPGEGTGQSRQQELFPGEAPCAPGRTKRERAYGRYYEFTQKFKGKQTTDDCLTPPAVYDAVLGFLYAQRPELEGLPVVRPFWPGGDYERHGYPEGCVVVDNPPFSQYGRIVRFFLDRGIPFFLFAPGLTCAHPDERVCTIVTGRAITYENGAKITTAFATDLFPGLRLWCCPALGDAIRRAQGEAGDGRAELGLPGYVVTPARLGKLARHAEWKLESTGAGFLRRVGGQPLYGGGFIISARQEASLRAAQEEAGRRAQEEARKRKTIAPGEKELRIKDALDFIDGGTLHG